MSKCKILAVDDEEFNLDILGEYLEDAGYEPIGAVDGVDALQKLDEHPDIQAIVLDRMMPNMDGIEFMNEISKHPTFRHLPVVMQTAAATEKQIVEGIDSGVFYYLTKPYQRNILLSIVRSALEESTIRRSAQNALFQSKHFMEYMESGKFSFRTLEDIEVIAPLVANSFPDPDQVIMGLSELMINAVEHGNLGITHDEKNELMRKGEWKAEINRRLTLPSYADRKATLIYEKEANDQIKVIIKDEGDGFDFNDYQEISPERMMNPNGRGIALARLVSFDMLEYIGNGSEVVCGVSLEQAVLQSDDVKQLEVS